MEDRAEGQTRNPERKLMVKIVACAFGGAVLLLATISLNRAIVDDDETDPPDQQD